MAKKYGLDKKKAIMLYIVAGVLFYGIFFYVPFQSQDVQCFTAPCPPIQTTLYDFVIRAIQDEGNLQPCLDESCTVPEICIDGIYFGVCGGEPIFNEGNSCFGLSTQGCFDKCNVIGNICREQTACIEIFQPVCGADGMTYSNSCFAGVNGVEVIHQGECT